MSLVYLRVLYLDQLCFAAEEDLTKLAFWFSHQFFSIKYAKKLILQLVHAMQVSNLFSTKDFFIYNSLYLLGVGGIFHMFKQILNKKS